MIVTILEAMAVLAVFVGLLNEKKIIRWEDRMIGKVRGWKHERIRKNLRQKIR